MKLFGLNKYGFVYLWYDTYRKMYYIGSHWGTESDGYVCSSRRMKFAYKKRPANLDYVHAKLRNSKLTYEDYIK